MTSTPTVSATNVAGLPLIGAIRWDAWYDPNNGTVAQAVEADLAPAAYLSSAPSFTTVTASGALSINGDTAAEMNSEIQLAASAGINYWAFDYYGPGDPMNNALQLYLQSPINTLVDFSLIDTAGWGATLSNFTAAINQRVALMEQPTYQCVDGNRPLYYLMLPSAAIIQQWWGGNPANMAAAVDYLRQQVIATAGANPYIVVMSSPLAAAAFAGDIGADAISAYDIHGNDTAGSYQTLANETVAGWNAELATGLAVIPTVMTGWNPGPRIETPAPWGSSGDATYATATPAEVAAQLASALAWVAAHPASTANTVLVYAWDEFDEGGSLASTYVAGDPAGDTSRLAALAALTALYNGAVATVNADGSTSVTLQDGTVEQFSAAGVLLRTIAADGSSSVYNPDNSVSKYTAAGLLYETDNSDGTSITYAADGTATWISITGVITRVINPDGSWQISYVNGWLWYSASGTYLQHEVDLPNGSKQFYNAAGHLTETDNANGTRVVHAADGTQTLYSASDAITKIVAPDGSSRVAWGNGWLWFSPSGTYLQHEADLSNGSKQFFNAAGHLTELDNVNGTRVLYAADHTQTFYSASDAITKIVAPDGSSRVAWSDGWLWFSPSGAYLQHEVDLSNGSAQFYNAAGHLTEIDNASGTVTLYGQSLLLKGSVAPLVLIAPSANTAQVTDASSGLQIVVGPTSTSVQVLGLATDPNWRLDMIGGVGGFASLQALLVAFRADGHGGSLLALPGSASIDLVGMAPASLTAGHFMISASNPAA
jgi:hypothetical protein